MMYRPDAALDRAVSRMWEPVIDWIHYPSGGKAMVFAAYAALDPKALAAYDADVVAAFERAHGSDTVVAYRYRSAARGGSSLTTKEPTYLDRSKYQAHIIHESDVLVHWAQERMPLSTKSFAHEQEIILRPDVRL